MFYPLFSFHKKLPEEEVLKFKKHWIELLLSVSRLYVKRGDISPVSWIMYIKTFSLYVTYVWYEPITQFFSPRVLYPLFVVMYGYYIVVCTMTENLKSANERKLSRLLIYLTGLIERYEVFEMQGDNLARILNGHA